MTYACGDSIHDCVVITYQSFGLDRKKHLRKQVLFSGWGGRIRTDECGSQSPVPYRLATPQYFICHLSPICFRKLPKYIIPYKIFYVNLFLFLYTQIFRYCKSLKFPIFLSILTIFVLNKNFIVFFVIM